VIQLGALLCDADHTASFVDEWRMIAGFIGASLFMAFLIWLCHLAIEPYVRRRWPHMLVSVKRLVAGRLRDPLVGSDILRGLIAAAAGIAAWSAAEALLIRRGVYLPLDQSQTLYSTRPLGIPLMVFDCAARGLLATCAALTVIVVARLIVRSDRAAFVVVWLVMTLAADDLGGSFLVDCALRGVLFAPMLLGARRHGALTLAAAFTAMFCLVYTPLTSDLGRWYGRFSAVVLVAIAAAGVYAFRTALAGKPLFGGVLVEDEAVA
jgi:hypothetical protein